MGTPPLPPEEIKRREDVINECLREGYAPLGQYGGRGSAIEEAMCRLGQNSASTSIRYIRLGRINPDWSLYAPPAAAADQRKLLKREAQSGYAPDFDLTHPLPEGLALQGTTVRYGKDGEVDQFWNKSKQAGRDPSEVVQLADPKKITKVSTLYDQQGNVTQQWVAEKPEEAHREALWRLFAAELAEALPRAKPRKGPAHVSDQLMAVYPVGDHHMGMLAWDKETGADYDLDIAERLLTGATDRLMAATPACSQALIVFLGDFLHYDSFEAVTPASRNLLDADSRFPKMVRASVRAIRYMVTAALVRHQKVDIIIEIGNHDPSSSIFLMECLANIYESEPRVTVDTSPMHYHYFAFGNVLIGVHHGHEAKMENLPLIMATDKPDLWGRARYRYWYTGHIHSQKTKVVVSQGADHPGCTVESFRILAPPDAWASQKGYRSIRDMKAIVHHREFGEIERHTVNPSMMTEQTPA